jgi:hypothetical protein
MAASTLPVPTPSTSDNYVLISSVTPVAAASTVSFTSISGYSKLMLRHVDTTLVTSGALSVTFNGDTGANYAYSQATGTSTITNSQTQKATNISFSASTGTAQLGATYIIDGITSTGPKPMTVFGSNSGQTVATMQGVYVATAAITTVTLTASTTFSGVGTVALYGVAA